MKDAAYYAQAFSAASFDPGKLKDFAQSLATFEAKTGIQPQKILVNGIVPFPDILTATYHVPKATVGTLIQDVLAHPTLDTDILVNGIPANEFYEVTFSLGRSR